MAQKVGHPAAPRAMLGPGVGTGDRPPRRQWPRASNAPQTARAAGRWGPLHAERGLGIGRPPPPPHPLIPPPGPRLRHPHT